MPLYFFEVTKNKQTTVAQEGLELADLDAAWEEATTACGEMIKALDGSLTVGTEWAIAIQDEFRGELRTLKVISTARR